MTHCTLIAQHGVPRVVLQALDDTHLTHVARLTMWHLQSRLDVVDFLEVKGVSLACEMRVKERTAYSALRELVARGYLLEHGSRKPRAYRFPWSRRLPEAVTRAA
jgi:hypothetical protein